MNIRKLKFSEWNMGRISPTDRLEEHKLAIKRKQFEELKKELGE